MYDFDRRFDRRGMYGRTNPTHTRRITTDRVIAYLRTRSVETWAFFAGGLLLGAWFG